MRFSIRILYAVLLFALPLSVSGCGEGGPDIDVSDFRTTPADAGAIAGPEGYWDGEVALLSIDEIPYATSYKWYRGNEAIEGAEGLTLDVTEPGYYRVAGVNERGEGRASEAKKIRVLTFTDRLVGQWDCKEFWVSHDEANQTDQLYTNDHVITITRTGDIADNKIAIANFFEANPPGTYTAFATTILYEGQTIPANGDTVVATVDETNETMQIPTGWLFTPTWKSGLNTELCPMIYDSNYADNVGEAFPAQHFFENDGTLSMEMVTGPLYAFIGPEQTPYRQTYMVALTSQAHGYETRFANVIGTVWTKRK